MSKLAAAAAAVTLLAALPARAEDDSHGPKSASTAVGLSIAGSLIGPALLVAADLAEPGGRNGAGTALLVIGGAAGVLLGPSAGCWYSGEARDPGLAIRGLGGGAIVIASVVELADVPSGHTSSTAQWAVYGGLAAIGVGTVYDWFEAPRAAHAYNRDRPAAIRVAPIIDREPGHDETGLAVATSF